MTERIPEHINETKIMRQMLRSAQLLYQRLGDRKNKSVDNEQSKFEGSMADLKESIEQLDNLLFLYENGNQFEDQFINITALVRRHIQTAREILSDGVPQPGSTPLHFPTKPKQGE